MLPNCRAAMSGSPQSIDGADTGALTRQSPSTAGWDMLRWLRHRGADDVLDGR